MPRIRINLETLRVMYRTAYSVASRFIDLDVIEQAVLSSRMIEYPFVLERLARRVPGQVLDIGCADSGNILAPTLAALGWHVYGVDIRAFKLAHPNFHFTQGDMRRTEFPDAVFDCAYAVSSIEHFGLAGRYGINEDDSDGDVKAMEEVRRVLKPGGSFLLTIPYGVGGIVRPAERVYNQAALRRLLKGWRIAAIRYHNQNSEGVWQEVPEEVAGRTRTPGGVCVALIELEEHT